PQLDRGARRARSRWRPWAGGSAALLLIVGIAVAWVLPASDEGTVELVPLFQDNFDAGEGWYEYSDDTATLGYDQGRYHISVKRPDHQAISDTALRGPTYGFPLTGLADVSVQVSVRAPSGTGLFGVTCRQAPETAAYYEGLVGTDGAAQIAKYDGGTFTTVARGRVSPRDPGQSTRVRLDCVGPPDSTTVTLFVDGRQAVTASDDNALPRGSIGLAAASGPAPSTDAFFDDLAVFSRPVDRS
ncbi:MAG: hypothetical protein M3179_11880, partial [Actinomycetota bacterium]|nr:hypothetical protein [Actinomycetota bacterium]